MRLKLVIATALIGISASAGYAQNQRERAVRDDKRVLEADTSWIYDDLAQARAAARAEGKPLMVLIRCLP